MDTHSTSEVNINGKVIAQQAVFTSIRTLMSEGYRLVAASPGVSQEERMEITQRCPSHGGLCDESESAGGLLSFRMKSGRFCVGYCSYAGTEQTGRGGNRVYTTLAILDRAGFDNFELNPVRVHAAIGRAVGTKKILDPLPRLEPLELRVGTPEYRPPILIDHVCRIIVTMLNNQALIVSGAAAPLETLEWLMLALPVPVRANLSTTAGLKFSTSRHTRLSFIPRDQGETKRMTCGHDLQWLDMETPIPKPAWPFNGWMDLVSRRWKEGNFNDINRLCLSLKQELNPGELDRAASVYHDIGLANNADASLLEQMIKKYAGFSPQNEAEIGLIKEFRISAKLQAVYLQKKQSEIEQETPKL
jgi:hypothetical protein